MNSLLMLYLQFIKIGLFSIGGGLATLPFLFELAKNNNYISVNELVDMIAISQCTPGPVGINVATFIGVKTGGILNGIMTTICLISSSFLIIYLIAHYLEKYYNHPVLQKGLKYLRICSLGFMFVALVNILNVSIVDWKTTIFLVAIFYLSYRYPKHPLFYLFMSGCLGMIIL